MPTPPRRAHTAVAVLLVLVGALCVPVGAHAAAQPRLIVGFRTGTDAATQAVALRHGSARSKRSIPALRARVVEVAPGTLGAARRRLLARDDVAFVEVDHVARAYGDAELAARGVAAQWRPDDVFLTQQWALSTIGAERAWEHSRGTGATIAVLDTGVDYIHPDLAGRVDLGRDFVDSDSDPMDVQGHGTHVAGAAAAGADDGIGIAGVAPGARILAVRVLDASGSGNYSQVADGIVYAVGRGAKVINLSLGGSQQSALLRQAIDFAAARGSIVTCATGNDGAESIGFPARYESCLAVGATDVTDQRAEFSNRGPGIDLVAPGADILSTTKGGGHEAWDGTSMATPYVSGTAALLVSQGLSRRDVLAAMTTTARDLGPRGADTTYGSGRVDAGAAIDAATRMPRRSADSARPVVQRPLLRTVRRGGKLTWQVRWKLRSRTPFRRVGTYTADRDYTQTSSRVRGVRRTTVTLRFRNGIVYRRTVVQVKVRKRVRSGGTQLPIRIRATDTGGGVDRVALSVDGKVQAIDWSGADGWFFSIPCKAGTRTYTAHAYDAADNEGRSTLRRRVTC